MRVIWTEDDEATCAFVDGLADGDAARVFTSTLPNGNVFRLALWQMMVHVILHGMQHRSEVAAVLTQFGQSPGDLDTLGFFQPFGRSQVT